jgi:hypothetical protein
MRVLCAVVAFACLLPSLASAATIQAASCSQDHVQAAINAAVDGDEVTIPAGSCVWPSHVSWDSKNITVRGAGIGQTIIARNGGDNGYIFWVSISSANKGAFRISSMTLTGTVTNAVFYVTSGSLAAVPAGRWRIDNIRFDFPVGQQSGVHTTGVNYGVVDHNTFNWQSGAAIRQANALSTECWTTPLSGDFQNSQPLDLGTDKFLFVEDNQFIPNGSPIIAYDASSGGGRIVFRKNRVTGGFFYNHWTRGCEMAAQVFEIYHNTFIGDANYGAAVGAGYPMRLEAGTGVIFGNTALNFRIGQNPPYIILNDRRASRTESSGWLGACDGTKNHDGNAKDPAAPGWPCLGQIGRSPGKTLAQIQAGDKPVSAPVYLWSNGEESTCATGGACTHTVGVWGDPAAYVRDTPHPNGEVDYVNGTPKPGYVPFVYPHPLVGGTQAPGPTPVPVPVPTPVPDVTAPVISLFSVGRRTGNNYPVTLTITDNVRVEHVEISVDAILQVRLTVPSSGTASWNDRVFIKSSGAHTVTAKAFDEAGNTSESSLVVNR